MPHTGALLVFYGNNTYNKLGVVTLLVSPQSAQIFSGYDTQQMPGQLYDGLNSG